MEQAGEIKDLRLQVDFTLQEAYTDAQGRRTRAIRYVADFTYLKPKGGASGASRVSWELVVEDVKARPTKTKSYTIKKKLMKDKFGTDITEV